MNSRIRKSFVLALTMLVTVAAAAQAADGPRSATATGSVRASVVRGTIHLGGIMLPDSEQTLVSYSSSKRRNNEYHIHFKSWLTRLFADDAHVSDLFQLDKNMAYKVFYNKREYYPCTVAECPTLYDIIEAISKGGNDSGKDRETYHPMGTEQCPMHQIRHGLVVRKTDQHRTINGFHTQLYRVTFSSVYADNAGREDNNTLDIKLWTTPTTGTIRQIQDMHRKLTQLYVAEQNTKPNPLARFVSKDVFHALDAFVGDTSNKDYAWHNTITRKLAQVDGYPVSIDLNWFVQANACPPPESTASEDGGFDSGNPLGRLESMIRHKVEKHIKKHVQARFRPDPDEPVLHWDRTITSIDMEQVDPAVFDVPSGFVKKKMPTLNWANEDGASH